MKVLISADMEGCSHIVRPEQIFPSGRLYEEARGYYTGDVNAAVEGALSGGATEVVVLDTHAGDQLNLLPETLHPEAYLIQGGFTRPLNELCTIEEGYDTIFALGRHTGVRQLGVLCHTYSGTEFDDLRVNGKTMTELHFTAAVAGDFGVPVSLVTGDNLICEQAQAFLPGVEVAVTKYALTRYVAKCVPLEKSRKAIREAAQRAIEKAKGLSPLMYEKPATLEIEFHHAVAAQMAARIPGVEYDGYRTISYTSDSFVGIYNVVLTTIAVISMAGISVPGL